MLAPKHFQISRPANRIWKSEDRLAFEPDGRPEEVEGELIRLKVNGQERTFDGDPEMPLLWYLRDVAGLTGTKFGCGKGLCGSCTVHKNGEAIRSCETTMQAAAGAEIITIEGISASNGALHPVQKAWMEIRVPQCGYCQTGQIMQAIAMLKTNKAPSDQDIDVAISGNLCRCGTYMRIRAAIHEAAKNLSAANQSEKERA